MTPEERAEATYQRIKHEMVVASHAFGDGEDAADTRWDICTHYIASAIRQAENDAIERAAQAAEYWADDYCAKGSENLSAAIRALIHKEP